MRYKYDWATLYHLPNDIVSLTYAEFFPKVIKGRKDYEICCR